MREKEGRFRGVYVVHWHHPKKIVSLRAVPPFRLDATRTPLCRLVAEVRPHDESLFSCIACTQDARGKPLLFAGTSEGGILQLDLDTIDQPDEREQRRAGSFTLDVVV